MRYTVNGETFWDNKTGLRGPIGQEDITLLVGIAGYQGVGA